MSTRKGYEYWITVDFGIDTLGDQPEQKFTSIGYTRLPINVRDESDHFLQQFLQPEALPSRAAKVDVSYFKSVNEKEKDLIESRWSFDRKLLRYVENVNAAKIEIPLDDTLDVKKANTLLSSIVKLNGQDPFSKFYQIELKWPAKFTDGIQFSSDASQFPFNMPVWYNRIDAFVLNGKLSIIFYKRPWYAPHPGFLPGNNWFVLAKLQDNRHLP